MPDLIFLENKSQTKAEKIYDEIELLDEHAWEIEYLESSTARRKYSYVG